MRSTGASESCDQSAALWFETLRSCVASGADAYTSSRCVKSFATYTIFCPFAETLIDRTLRAPFVSCAILMRRDVDAKNLILTFDAGREQQRAAGVSPLKVRWQEVEVRHGLCGGTAGGWGDHDLLRLLVAGGADERDRLSVRRPTRRVVRSGRRRHARQRAAIGGNDPHVGVAAVVVELVAAAIGDERDLRPIRRPLRIVVVPRVAVRDLLCRAAAHLDGPQVRASVVEPSVVIELV